jgi:predicted anti-sigma-YlaC factor YlaD
MSKEHCEKIRISTMAILDGEKPLLLADEVDEHTRSCAHCRRELEQQKQTAALLHGQTRRVFAEDLWPTVAASIEPLSKPNHPRELPLFVMLGLFLLAYKIIGVLPGFHASVLTKLVPLVIVFVFFSLLKQNPLTINQNLRPEGDTR